MLGNMSNCTGSKNERKFCTMTLNSMAFFVVTPANITVIVLRSKWNVKNSRECNFQFLLQIQHMLTVFDVLGEWFSVCTCVSLATSFTEAPQRIILTCSHQPLCTELMAYIDNMLNTVSLLSVVHRMFNLLFIFLVCLVCIFLFDTIDYICLR